MAIPSSNPSFEPDKAYLLWRTFHRVNEVREGAFRLNKETTIRMFKNNPDGFLNSNSELFIKSCLPMLGIQANSPEKEKTVRILTKIYDLYQKEINYGKNRNKQFSIDILFSIIETIIMESGGGKTESALLELDTQKSAVTKQDLEEIVGYLKTFNKMQSRFLACGTMKKAIEMSDSIITQAATENLNIPIVALDIMFNLITAQFVLSQKYNCKHLLVGWKKEYGFSDEETKKIVSLLPLESNLLEFRTHYAKALQTLQAEIQKGDPTKEMDLFLLRTVSNYFTSWINQVANQISKKE